MSAVTSAKSKIKGRKLKLVMAEGQDERIKAAAQKILDADLAVPILFGDKAPVPSQRHIEIVMAQRPKMTATMATKLLSRPLYAACAMVAAGEAHAVLGGAVNTTAHLVEAALMTIGLLPGIKTPSSFFLMQWPDHCLIFSDCAVNVQPSSEQLADIAIATAKTAKSIL